jgi:hypothetical protein
MATTAQVSRIAGLHRRCTLTAPTQLQVDTWLTLDDKAVAAIIEGYMYAIDPTRIEKT